MQLSETSQRELAAAAKLGAKALDTMRHDWWVDIKRDALKMDNCENCIFGQVFGGFFEGALKLMDYFTRPEIEVAALDRNPSSFGFDVPMEAVNSRDELLNDHYDYLEKMWLKQIEERESKAAVMKLLSEIM